VVLSYDAFPIVGAPPLATTGTVPLGQAAPGFRGVIRVVDATGIGGVLPAEELERRLLEMGLVEGAEIEIRHQGLFRRDPIAVRVNGYATFALRRHEAGAILVTESIDRAA
jgi:ferrous iron transport protein A